MDYLYHNLWEEHIPDIIVIEDAEESVLELEDSQEEAQETESLKNHQDVFFNDISEENQDNDQIKQDEDLVE